MKVLDEPHEIAALLWGSYGGTATALDWLGDWPGVVLMSLALVVVAGSRKLRPLLEGFQASWRGLEVGWLEEEDG